MAPAYVDGDLVLVDPRAFALCPPRPGDVVLSPHPYRAMTILKRVATVSADGRVRLVGDNAADSIDSRQFGGVLAERLQGRVVGRLQR
jgi:hypothetical protein